MSLPPPPTAPACYRHPNREAGRSCTRCGKPACSDCLVQAAVGSHCLDCAKAARPDVQTRVRLANSRILTPATYSLIGANVLVFVWMVLLNPDTLSASITQQHADLALNRTIVHYTHEWYRFVTSGFIHFGIIHVMFNMILLIQLGNLIEREIGSWRFTLIFFASLLGGSFGVLLMDGTSIQFTGGASGAVFGLLGAAAVGLHRRGVNVFTTGIGMTLLLNIVFTLSISGVSVGGHFGGVIAGAICGWFVLAPPWRPQATWIPWGVPALVAGVCLAGCFWASTQLPVALPGMPR